MDSTEQAESTAAETTPGAAAAASTAPLGESPELEAPLAAEGDARLPAHVQEISQENIKNRINEVITEIEREVEREEREDCEDAEEDKAERDMAPPSVATPPPTPEPAEDRLESTGQSQGQSTDQSQPEAELVSGDASSGLVPDQNSDQPKSEHQNGDQSKLEHQDNDQPKHQPEPSPETPSALNATEAPVEEPVRVPTVQSEPPSHYSEAGRFTSPFSSSATSSLPRGWTPGGMAFAVFGQPGQSHAGGEAPTAQWGTREAPGAPWGASHAPATQWDARGVAESSTGVHQPVAHYATLPRSSRNAVARGWESVAHSDPPKKVHFAEKPQVQTFEDEPVTLNSVTLRPQPATTRGPRPLSAPAAAQLFTIPNMAARPYGRTSPLLVTTVGRTSPLPLPGGDDAQMVAGNLGDASNENHEMSGSSQETDPGIPPPPPPQAGPLPKSRIFSPPDDEPILPHKKKTMFVDSAFFSPKVHPTWEQQVELAKKISASLSDASNRQSRGQSMYERRKKRSVKWVHQGGSQSDAGDDSETPQKPKDKPLLQLVMNPHGHVYDLNALKKQGWIIDSKGGLSPDVCSDLVKDLNSPNGKGAQIFAKRKKRAEKWVVDETHRETRRAEESPAPPAAPQPPPAAPQPPAAAPQPPQPPQQLPTVQLKPVPLQSLYQAPQQPQFPSGGVYAPRTAHSWAAAQNAAPPLPEVTMRRPPASDQHAPGVTASALENRHRNRQSWANYNTAPRGWGNSDNFYRPVTFTQPLLSQ